MFFSVEDAICAPREISVGPEAFAFISELLLT